MIDLHAHVLPGLEDGPRDLDEALAMLALAAREGIQTVVAVARYNCFMPGYPALAAERLSDLRSAAQAHDLPVNLVGAFEVTLSPALADLGAGARALGINGGRYLLVAPPERRWPPFAGDVLERLQHAGLRPIIAHAARQEIIAGDADFAADLVRRGVRLQVTAASLLGAFGRATRQHAQSLVERGLISFLGSGHRSLDDGAPRLRAAARLVKRLIGPAAAEAIVRDNPTAVLNDADLPSAPLIVRKRFSSIWYIPVTWLPSRTQRDRFASVIGIPSIGVATRETRE